MPKKAKVLSDDGVYLEVEIEKFYSHLQRYHASGTSIHEEKGHFFTVNNNFRKGEILSKKGEESSFYYI